MSGTAWTMLIVGAILLWGGFAASVYNALKADKK